MAAVGYFNQEVINMIKMKKITALVCAALLALCAAGCGTSGGSGKSMKIGLAAPLTGANAEDGKAIQEGVMLAIKQINDQGGIDGNKLEVVSEDDKGDPSEAVKAAEKLAKDENTLAVIGHFKDACTLPAASIYNEAGLVQITPASKDEAVSDAGDYTFRTIPTDTAQAESLARWCVNDLGYKKVAVLCEHSDLGKGLADKAQKAVEDLGAKVVVRETYKVNETDFNKVLSKTAKAKPDVLIIGGLCNETGLIAQQRSKAGIADLPIMGMNVLYSDDLLEMDKKAVEGIKMTAYYSASSERQASQDFIKAYTEEYGKAPSTYAAYAYDSANIIIDAIKNAGADRAAIHSRLADLKDYEGVTGNTSFDENGDVVKEPLRMEIKDGKFVVVDK